ncbi:C-type lectin domain family 12 member B [Dissostichus eleginoides]|uniref:C-type lectin domain family 12 member B n=1 Tax=Dissostichus eleginoides TaxID=100907 RepID=A0AAD9BDA8_DISEL|nr:C-type lectin domain family 12 member B [Dissostichus eleginoides]
MSSNIYDDINLNVRYTKGAREDEGQREERLVDIYDSAGTEDRVLKQDGGARSENHPPSVQRTRFRAAALTLGLLCLLLLVGVIVLSTLYISMQTKIEELQTSIDKLKNSYCSDTNNQTGWRRFGCRCYFKSTEVKNWTESRRDCWERGAELVIIGSREEQDFTSELSKAETSWIGLQAVRSRWVDEWEWVDGSPPTYSAWKSGLETNPLHGALSTAYIDLDGTWTQTSNGSKGWICEKQITFV